jgi:hypothetical protein
VEDAEAALAAAKLAAAASASESPSEEVLMLDADDGREAEFEEAKTRRLQEDLAKQRREHDQHLAERLAAVHLTDPLFLSRWETEGGHLMSEWHRRAQAIAFAREWRLTPSANGGALLFDRSEAGARVLDFGPMLSVANGNAAGAMLAVKVIQEKLAAEIWRGPVVVKGTAEFKLAFIRAALDAGVEIRPRAGEDSEILARVHQEREPPPLPIHDPFAQMRADLDNFAANFAARRSDPVAEPTGPGDPKP